MECYFTKGVLIIKPNDVNNTIHIKKLIRKMGIQNALVDLSEYESITQKEIDNLKIKGINLHFFGIPEKSLIKGENELTALSNFEI